MPEINDLDGLSDEQVAALEELIQKRTGRRTPIASTSPAAGKFRKRKPADSIKYLDDDETKALFRAIAAGGSARDLAIFEVAYHRGLRASEVGRIQIAQLRSDLKRMRVERLKGSNSGEYLLTERETKALRGWLRIRGKDEGPLFPSRNRRGISRRRLDELMKRYGSAAGLPPEKRHFHCLKHSCGTSLLDQRVPIEEVQDHLGHRDIRNTMKYARITNARRLELGEKLRQRW